MILLQVPDKPAGRCALIPQGIQSRLDRFWHLNQHPHHFHRITPFLWMISLLSHDSEVCKLMFDAIGRKC